MPTPQEYRERRAARRAERQAKADRLRRWVPVLEVFCRKHSICMNDIPSGFQFRLREYIVNWWLPTNKIVIQFVGSDDHKEFQGDAVPNEPKIITALKKLVEVTKEDTPSVMKIPS
jgi:hypothetical protein